MTLESRLELPSECADLAGRLEAAQSALAAAHEREAALHNDIEHQFRNALAVTRLMFLRTMDNAETVEHARVHFVGRLDALARYNARLAVGGSLRFDLETMAWDELISMALGSDKRIEVTGPKVLLEQRVAAMIGLALHELATNSVKFGVLGDQAAGGRLRIRWERTGQRVELEWAESGVPVVASAPIASGFGRDFIENALPYQLNAETEFEFVPGGLLCRVRFDASTGETSEPFAGQAVDLL